MKTFDQGACEQLITHSSHWSHSSYRGCGVVDVVAENGTVKVLYKQQYKLVAPWHAVRNERRLNMLNFPEIDEPQ